MFNSIPYYGPLTVTGGLSIVAFLQFGTLPMTGAIAGVALLITTLEGWILTPALMGRVAAMNNIAVFAGLLFWSWVWGVPGMLVAAPMMMIIKAVCDRVEDLQPIGRFLGEWPHCYLCRTRLRSEICIAQFCVGVGSKPKEAVHVSEVSDSMFGGRTSHDGRLLTDGPGHYDRGQNEARS